jgi:hypothetical protein
MGPIVVGDTLVNKKSSKAHSALLMRAVASRTKLTFRRDFPSGYGNQLIKKLLVGME